MGLLQWAPDQEVCCDATARVPFAAIKPVKRRKRRSDAGKPRPHRRNTRERPIPVVISPPRRRGWFGRLFGGGV